MTDSKAAAVPARGNWFKDFALPAITVVTPLLLGGVGYWLSASQDDLKEQIAAVDLQVKQLEAERQERESVQNFHFRVLDEVKQALENREDPAHQAAVIVLVDSLSNKELARGWLKALAASEKTSEDNREVARTALKALDFDQELLQTQQRQVPVNAPAFDWEDYDYDIFYCEASPPQAKQIAEAIVAGMQAENARGRLRARPLPETVNARPGYGISGFEIRRNANEVDQAQALKRIGDRVLGTTGSFVIGTSNQVTPYYLSAFVCPSPAG